MGCMNSEPESTDAKDEKQLLQDTDFNDKYDFLTEYNTTLDSNVTYKEAVSRRPSVSIFIANIDELKLNENDIKEDNDGTVFVKKYFKRDEWNSLSFRREATILSTLSHNNIVSYIASYQDHNAYYLVIEYCNEETLISYIYNNYKNTANDYNYNESIIRCIISTLIDILRYCHSLHIVHRNICLENIRVLNGEYKLIGFDDAEIIDDKQDVFDDFVGSNIYYLSPETFQIRHRSALKKIDVFAVGVIAFILSFGSVPFSGIKHTNICKKIMNHEYNWPKNRHNFVSKNLLAFIKSLLSPYPFSRPSANEAKSSDFLKRNVIVNDNEKLCLINTIPFKLHCYQYSMKIRKLLMENECKNWTNFEQNQLIEVLENIFNLEKEEISSSDLENLLIKMGFNKDESRNKTKQFFNIMNVCDDGNIKMEAFNAKRRYCAQRLYSNSSRNFEYSPVNTQKQSNDRDNDGEYNNYDY